MIERVLNRLGLYTKGQYVRLENLLHSCNDIRHQAITSLLASEEAKANVIKENKKLKSDYENVVAELKDFREMLKNRNHIIDCMSKDLKKLKKENEELKKEVERLRLKVARSVKRKKR